VTWVLGNPDHFIIAYSASLLMACSTIICVLANCSHCVGVVAWSALHRDAFTTQFTS